MTKVVFEQEMVARFGAGSFKPLAGRGNSSVGIWQSNTVYFVKHYPADPNWNRRRVEAETVAFYTANNIASIPQLLYTDEADNYSVFTFIDGSPEYAVTEDVMTQLRAFLDRIMSLKSENASLGEAKEAFFHTRTLRSHIDGRYAFLREIKDDQLQDHLDGQFKRALELTGYAARADIDCGSEIIISPSDFGTHNSLRTPEGDLYFIDFEYGGRDCKYKLLADIDWHPGSVLDEDQRQKLIAPYLAGAGEQEIFQQVRQMMGLKWALLVLNEFIPGQLEKRLKAALTKDSADEIKKRQLEKSRKIIDKILHS